MAQTIEKVLSRDYSILVLQKALDVLDVFLDAQTPLSLDQICQRTGIPKSTAFRIVTNLVQRELLIETDNGYWLGLKMLRFGTLVEGKLSLAEQARPFLTQLRDRFNESVHLAVLDRRWQVVHLESLYGEGSVVVMLARDGQAAPVHATALGKALAAFRDENDVRKWVRQHPLRPLTESTITKESALLRELAEVRRRGYAVDQDEYEVGLRCIAAPVRDRSGQVIAAVSMSGPDSRMRLPLIGSEQAEEVVRTAEGLSKALGYEGGVT